MDTTSRVPPLDGTGTTAEVPVSAKKRKQSDPVKHVASSSNGKNKLKREGSAEKLKNVKDETGSLPRKRRNKIKTSSPEQIQPQLSSQSKNKSNCQNGSDSDNAAGDNITTGCALSLNHKSDSESSSEGGEDGSTLKKTVLSKEKKPSEISLKPKKCIGQSPSEVLSALGSIKKQSVCDSNPVNSFPKPSPAHIMIRPDLPISGEKFFDRVSDDMYGLSAPLNLCMKKRETMTLLPSVPSSLPATSMSKPSLFVPTNAVSGNQPIMASVFPCHPPPIVSHVSPQLTPQVVTPGPRKRGRKPKNAALNFSTTDGSQKSVLISQVADKDAISSTSKGKNDFNPLSASDLKPTSSAHASSKGVNLASWKDDKIFPICDKLQTQSTFPVSAFPAHSGSDTRNKSNEPGDQTLKFSVKKLFEGLADNKDEHKSRKQKEIREVVNSSKSCDGEDDSSVKSDTTNMGGTSDSECEVLDSDATGNSGAHSISKDKSGTGKGTKRSSDDDDDEDDEEEEEEEEDEDDDESEGVPKKRKRVLPDEKEIRIPLEHGWRRQTKIRCFSRSGVRGEVIYFAPCGKKLRNYPEVLRYLSKHGITDINRENFSFSTKVNAGEFLERVPGGKMEEFVMINEQEVLARIEEIRARRRRSGGHWKQNAQRNSSGKEGHSEAKELSPTDQDCMEMITEKISEMERLKKLERERIMAVAREAKRVKAEIAKKQKEQEAITKQQEQLEKVELLRREKEARTQQLIEARKKRREENERNRQEENARKIQDREIRRQQAEMLKEQEMQKRREMILMADLERERRRQHMLLVRALEIRKKQEEREKKREEILEEKRINKEKKLEKRRAELQFIREMRKPVEDMLLKDLTPLPTLNRIPGLKLPGKAFADLLMTFEFLKNFGETLGFDMDNLPTLNTFQMALLNLDEKCEDELLSVVHHLLVCVIDDPGVPTCPQATSVLGQKLRDVDITNNNISEVLRLYFMAHNKNGEIFHRLKEKPFLSLNSTHKAEILAFLCNELLCSRAIVRQIDNSIDNLNVLRRDKWMVEGELRKLRSVHHRRTVQSQEKNLEKDGKNKEGEEVDSKVGELEANGHASDAVVTGDTGDQDVSAKDMDDEDNEDAANDSGNDSDETQEGQVSDAEEEELGLTNEELTKRIEKLTKQQNQFQNKITKASHTLRAMSFGQDRYKRRYWVLPCCGGVFVEGMESAELEEDKPSSPQNRDKSEPVKNSVNKKLEISLDLTPTTQKEVKKEPESTPSETQLPKPPSEPVPEEHKSSKDATIIKLHPDSDSKVSEQTNSSAKKAVKEELPKMPINPLSNQNWLLHSPFIASVLTGSMLFGNSLMQGKDVNGACPKFPSSDSGMPNSPFLPLMSFPTGFMSPEQIVKSLVDLRSNVRPWFSILPRMPCDEKSLTRLQESSNAESKKSSRSTTTNKADRQSSTPKTSQPAPHTSPKHTSEPACVTSSASTAFTNLQLGLLNGIPPSVFMHALMNPQTTSSAHQNSSSSSYAICPPSSTTATSSSPMPGMLGSTPPLTTSTPITSAVPFTFTLTPTTDSKYPNYSLAAKKKALEQLQHDTVQPTPVEMQRGWWRITEQSQVKTVMAALHSRGIREKTLQKQLQKHFSYACSSYSKDHQQVLDFEITDKDREISQKLGGAPDKDSPDSWSPNVALRVDLAVLEQVENLEERVAGASMQIKGWKILPRASTDKTINFHPACKHLENIRDTSVDLRKNSYSIVSILSNTSESKDSVVSADNKMDSSSENTDKTDGNHLQEVQDTPSHDLNAKKEADKTCTEVKDDAKSQVAVNPVELAKQRLLSLEAAIERRYIKPPLGFSTNELNISSLANGNDASHSADEAKEVPSGLIHWQEAVKKCQTSAQLSMCMNMLESCIAWDKSIMRASCQFCHSGDNEDMLLLCDGCDKGYHTYCFKPKMETIPEGDWFCYECVSKATGEKVCIYCGKDGKVVTCDTCSKSFHMNCLEPPLSKPPKGKWVCPGCHHKPKKSSSKRSGKDKESKKEHKESNRKSDSGGKGKSGEHHEKNKLQKDLGPCRSVLGEMEQHEDAWPFLLPVNTKQFPTYRKFIKRPMDLATLRNKLESGGYKTRDDFAADARLIFDNCETFNEDDSPVGQAGHNLRSFFDARWNELCAS